jgi:cytidylate kinase
MSIITISRGSYSNGKEVAEKVAQELGYECVSRDIILEASEEFNVPEIKLIRAVHDAPSILERFAGGKRKFIAYFRASLLEHFQKDNVVYHGLAGHFFVMGIPHVLKVRIMAEMADRVKLEMEREGIPERSALHILKSDDEERRKWSRHLYGIDTWDPTLYDMVVHIKKLTCDDVASLICRTARLEHFQTTPESQQAMDDLTISAKVKAALIDVKPDAEVFTENGVAHIRVKSSRLGDDSHMRRLAKHVPGVKGVEIGARDIKLTL